MRASRTCTVAGHKSHPYTFYMGVCNGGVWKTTDAGTTWTPIFDEQPTQSIGSIAIAPSNPQIIYVGSGEGLHRPDLSIGDGIYKSTDAGRTWTHLGLRDGQQIPEIVVDPRNPDRLFVAVLGHPYGPNPERGIYRSTDGGQTFTQVLTRGENIGARDVDIDPSNPEIVYATFWEDRQGPWENAAWNGTGGGIFKSTDGGTTWRPLTNGLPQGLLHAEITIAPSRPQRLYAIVATAGGGPSTGSGQGGRGGGAGGGVFYRSDDGGETWTKPTTDNRAGNQRVSESNVFVHPGNPDDVIVTDIVTFRSTDGGARWVPFKGAPGGEDYQNGWINPDDPRIMILIADQGAVVTLNNGETWSSWYNQPTAQMYHIAADTNFPYRVCSGQQESGSACVASRGDYGAISIREWLPVGVDEYRLRGSRSAESPDRLRRPQRDSIRLSVGPDRDRRPSHGPRRRSCAIPAGADASGCFLGGRPTHPAVRQQLSLEDHRRRHDVAADQRRSHAPHARRATQHRHLRATGAAAVGQQRRAGHLHHRSFAAGRESHLGRHR